MPTPSKNHATSRDYELLVHTLVEQQISGMSGVDVIELSRNAEMTGLSGYVHQIDVMYRIRIWLTEMLVVVECKQYAKSVGVDDLLEFRSRLDDLRAHKGIFVTSSNYQSGAIEFARANRIALLVVNATKELAILYSLRRVPIEERCARQIDQLHEAYVTAKSGKSNRLAMDRGRERILIQHDGVVLEISPGEFDESMLYKQPCSLSDDDRNGIYFSRSQFSHLRTNKLLKSLVLDELLGNNING
jgi:hypothetical protein